jgi:MFS family permease
LGINEPGAKGRRITLDSGGVFVRSLWRGSAAWFKRTLESGAFMFRRGSRHESVQDTPSANPPSTARDGPVQLPLAPLLISAFLWSLVTGAVYAVWANYMVSRIGYSRTEMARLWAMASLSEFPLMIVAGWLSDRIGRLPMLSLGFVAWTIVFLGYVIVPGMPWIMLVQLTRGFAYSAFTATAMTYATEVRDKASRGRISGLYSSVSGVGSIMGSSLGGGLAQLAGFVIMILTNATLICGGAVYLAVASVRHKARSIAGFDRSG